ncbi:MAG: NAD(+) diphosphatase [Eubacteriaceae bacterium]|nr:NAD(+) diphosphatase [Eubacteriaceae bacterium]
MLQDIYPHKLNIDFSAREGACGGYAVCIRDGQVLVSEEDGMIGLPRLSDPKAEEALYLFMIDDDAYFLVRDELTLPGYAYRELSVWRDHGPAHTAYALSLASRLDIWYRANRFCGFCGTVMEHSLTERAMVCPSCGATVYPRIDPCIIAAVVNGEKICLIHYGGGRSGGNYALVAGYIESGETPEDALRREVMEEVGLRVKNIRYYRSQPWPVSGSLLLGFFCELDGPDEITVDPGELSDASWVKREDIPVRTNEISLTAEMIELFRTKRERDF